MKKTRAGLARSAPLLFVSALLIVRPGVGFLHPGDEITVAESDVALTIYDRTWISARSAPTSWKIRSITYCRG